MNTQQAVPATMLAATLQVPGNFTVRQVPTPAIGPDDALIRVVRCGICGTDVHIFNGAYASEYLPMIPGHEFAGTVAAVGERVEHLAVSTRVVVDMNIGCGNCYYCRHNEILNCPQMKQVGIHRDGAFAEYVSIPARLVLPADKGIKFADLAMVEPISCVVRSARKSGISFGRSVAIIGAGPIGNLHVQMMRLIGAAPIIVVEQNRNRALLARTAGADVVVERAALARNAVEKATAGRGVDLAIEAVGNPELYELAFKLIRPGGHVAAFGLSGPDDTFSLGIVETVLSENSVKGSVAGMGEDVHDALQLVSHNRFNLKAFTGEVCSLADIQQVFEGLADHPECLKVQFALS